MDLSARGIRGALVHTRAGGCWEQGLHKEIVQEQIHRIGKNPLLSRLYNKCNRTKGRICTRELQQ